ncbi:hypothetical protein [Streptomyces sp. NPDC096193]|uniref:hypothetical protein n=1 Tax=Streptomyces sp. NPDC096193 TaxID=3155821 RepID=UPI0033252327
MPATLYVTHHPALLSAPLSRTEDAHVVPSPCHACGIAGGADWLKVNGVGVLVHNARGLERCPVATPFDWETGKSLALAGAVAA